MSKNLSNQIAKGIVKGALILLAIFVIVFFVLPLLLSILGLLSFFYLPEVMAKYSLEIKVIAGGAAIGLIFGFLKWKYEPQIEKHLSAPLRHRMKRQDGSTRAEKVLYLNIAVGSLGFAVFFAFLYFVQIKSGNLKLLSPDFFWMQIFLSGSIASAYAFWKEPDANDKISPAKVAAREEIRKNLSEKTIIEQLDTIFFEGLTEELPRIHTLLAGVVDTAELDSAGWKFYRGSALIHADKLTAIKLFERSAELGSALSAYNMAMFFEEGFHVEKDVIASKYWLEKAVALGSDEALYKSLKKQLSSENPTEVNLARKKIEDLCEEGNGVGHFLMFESLYKVNSEIKDYAEIRRHLIASVDQKFRYAQIEYSYFLIDGKPELSIERNLQVGIQLLSEAGSASDDEYLGYLYFNGKEVEQSDFLSFYYLSEAVLRDSLPKASYLLGFLYQSGRGAPEDAQKAFKHYLLSAEQGYSHAEFEVASCYALGYGVDRDDRLAVEYLTRSAEHGSKVGRVKLASLYLEGELVMKNYSEARGLLEAAAYQGSADAQGMLGEMYENGRGVEVDLVNAYAWYSLCYKSERAEKAKLSCERLESKMIPDQIDQAQSLAQRLQVEIAAALGAS